MATWTQDGMISTRIIAPMHEGSIRFLKTVGRWGGELEKRHNALLAMHAKQ
jgi:hypothetical protein